MMRTQKFRYFDHKSPKNKPMSPWFAMEFANVTSKLPALCIVTCQTAHNKAVTQMAGHVPKKSPIEFVTKHDKIILPEHC